MNIPKVLDIAANDGCLLEQFKKEGFIAFGVEPSLNLGELCKQKGIITYHGFWDADIDLGAKDFNIITATNVLAHVDDIKGFLKSVCKHLHYHGIFLIEVPYLFNMVSKKQFDTIYHEHLSYFLFKPLKIAFSEAGLKIFKVEKVNIHGGSLRVFACKDSRNVQKSISGIQTFEKRNKLYSFKTYSKYSKEVNSIKESFINLLHDLKKRKKKVAAYGASAKGISLLNYCGADNTDISYIADDTPQKQGKYTPGCNIPVVDKDNFDSNAPDYIALLAWNFSDELLQNTVSHKLRGGKYIIPIPKVRIV